MDATQTDPIPKPCYASYTINNCSHSQSTEDPQQNDGSQGTVYNREKQLPGREVEITKEKNLLLSLSFPPSLSFSHTLLLLGVTWSVGSRSLFLSPPTPTINQPSEVEWVTAQWHTSSLWWFPFCPAFGWAQIEHMPTPHLTHQACSLATTVQLGSGVLTRPKKAQSCSAECCFTNV